MAFLTFCQMACTSFPEYPVAADFLGERIETTVDSPAAQYYLNEYLQGNRKEPELDRKITRLYSNNTKSVPDRNDLLLIAQQYSNDFAALYFADRLYAEPENSRLERAFNKNLNLSEKELFEPPEGYEQYSVLMVPGWNYLNNGKITGSDLEVPREYISRLGVDNYLVNVPATRGLHQSVPIIRQAIEKFSKNHRKIIIVGASSAAPSIHYTLGHEMAAEQLDSVVAWINLGGIIHGSPLIDYFQEWPQKLVFNTVSFLRGWDRDEILTMSAEQSRKRVPQLTLPAHLKVINYIGLSLTGDLSQHARYKYPYLADQGPNDGLTLLADIVVPNSLSLVAARSDHYFQGDPLIEEKTIAILKLLIESIEKGGGF
ncbi:MAG: hypothetical protein ACI845_003253 [Gammaproteobacteria bacterium]|jgi:hypothetical protein